MEKRKDDRDLKKSDDLEQKRGDESQQAAELQVGPEGERANLNRFAPDNEAKPQPGDKDE